MGNEKVGFIDFFLVFELLTSSQNVMKEFLNRGTRKKAVLP